MLGFVVLFVCVTNKMLCLILSTEAFGQGFIVLVVTAASRLLLQWRSLECADNPLQQFFSRLFNREG